MYIQNEPDPTTTTSIASTGYNGDENANPAWSVKDADFQSELESESQSELQDLERTSLDYTPNRTDNYLSNGTTAKKTNYDVNDDDDYTYDESTGDNNNGEDEAEDEETAHHDETWKISHEVRAYIEYLERQLQIHQTPPHSPELHASATPIFPYDHTGGASKTRKPSSTSQTQKYINHLESNLQSQIESSATQLQNLRTLNANLTKENRALKWEVLEWKGKVDGEREKAEGEVGGLKRRIRELEGRIEEDEGFIRELLEKGDGKGSWELRTGEGEKVAEMEREVEKLREQIEEDRRVILELQDENEGLRFGSLKAGRGVKLDLGSELEELEGVEEMEEGCDDESFEEDVSQGEYGEGDEDEIEDEGQDASVVVGLEELESKMLSMSIEHLKEQVEQLLLFCT